MQFTEKRLRVKWYGSFDVAWRITPTLGQALPGPYGTNTTPGVAMRF
jgi:hypothetical protein